MDNKCKISVFECTVFTSQNTTGSYDHECEFCKTAPCPDKVINLRYGLFECTNESAQRACKTACKTGERHE